MKYLIIAALAVAAAVTGYAATAYCWDCPPRRCYGDITCGLGCFCYKGEYDLEGVCVTE